MAMAIPDPARNQAPSAARAEQTSRRRTLADLVGCNGTFRSG